MPSQPPVLLLHGMGCGPWVWRDVLPFLEASAIPAVLAGHRGGTPLTPYARSSPAEQMVDDLERQLDAAGIDKIHAVGNSLGGWLALRLAERGRTVTALCLAPAGGWSPGTPAEKRLVARFRLGRHVAQRVQGFPALLMSPPLRRAVLHPVAENRRAATRATTAAFVRDLASCQALDLAIRVPATRHLQPITDPGVPTTIVWSEKDRVLDGPWAIRGYENTPAEIHTLEGVGHMPMLDNPAAVANLILQHASTANR